MKIGKGKLVFWSEARLMGYVQMPVAFSVPHVGENLRIGRYFYGVVDTCRTRLGPLAKVRVLRFQRAQHRSGS
jgi:hypothetical protein